MRTPVGVGVSTSAAPAAGPGNFPLAVVPFAYQQRGILSFDYCNLVVYPDRLIIAFIPPERMKEFKEARSAVEAALVEQSLQGKTFWKLAASAGSALFRLSWSPPGFFAEDAIREKELMRKVFISLRPWERYLSMPSDAVLSEDRRNVVIPRDTIAYTRGESDPSTNTDQVHIRSAAGLTRLFFEFGTYSLARAVLNAFRLPDHIPGERVIGVLPSANEPEVEGFGFQYTWTLAFTGQRVVFAMDTDEFVDKIDAWLKGRHMEAKKAGRKLREGELFGEPDAPWQALKEATVSSLLNESDVNFYIPLEAIQSAQVIHGNEVRFDLPGGPYTLVFAEGSTGYIREVLGQALGERLL